jgi:hypothetical protein
MRVQDSEYRVAKGILRLRVMNLGEIGRNYIGLKEAL